MANIFSNLINGSVNYKKVVEDYISKDRSVTACYGRNHISKPAQGFLGLLLLIAFIGCLQYAFSGNDGGIDPRRDKSGRPAGRENQRDNRKMNNRR
jgi:hypothetical protein